MQWSDRAKSQQDRIVAAYGVKRNSMNVEPGVDIADLLAARDDLAVLEKTSNASVRKNTQSSINKVMIGRVSINECYVGCLKQVKGGCPSKLNAT